MNRRSIASLILGCAFVLYAGIAGAQQAPPPPPPRDMMMQAGPGGDFPPPFGERMELLGFGGMRGGKVVTGAPFSAVAVSETTQTLADGTHINRKTQSNVYRDSQGRVRREVTIAGFGPMAPSGQPKSFVVINDPVAGATFMLHPDHKTAEKMGRPFGHGKGAIREGLQNKMGLRQQQEIANGTLKKVDLGTCDPTVAGSCPAGVSVPAQGTQIIKTIPQGQIGNDQAITITHERWYSNELQTVVMSKHGDPWSGETTYTLTNIQRAEPNASLFAVPSDYAVTEGGPGRGARGAARRQQAPPPAEN